MNLTLINSVQEKLQTSLGSSYGSYLENTRDWFGQQITKDFFDEQLSSILNAESLQLHNELMKLIIHHCSPTDNANENGGSNNIIVPNSTTYKNITSVESFQTNSPMCMETTNLGSVTSQDEADFITISFLENDEIPLNKDVEDSEEHEQEDEEVRGVDWLYDVDLVYPSKHDLSNVPFSIENRCPMDGYHRVEEDQKSLGSLKYAYNIGDKLLRNPRLKKHFPNFVKENHIYLSAGSSIHGKFVLKAWEFGLDGVDEQASNYLVDGVKEHLKLLLTAIIRQKRAFRMREENVLHSMGVPYPNPYLLQGQHLYDEAYSSDSVTLADVMQVPSLLSAAEEQERLAAIQLSATAPPKYSRFLSNIATSADLLNVIENEPNLIPAGRSRYKLRELILQSYSGYGGNHFQSDNDEDEYNSQELLPICSY